MNNLFQFPNSKIKRTREVFQPRNTKTPPQMFYVAHIVGDCLKHLGIFDQDIAVIDRDAPINDGDLAVVKHKGQEFLFLIYFANEKVILHGEKIEIVGRESVTFCGRLNRIERDFPPKGVIGESILDCSEMLSEGGTL